MPPHDEPSFRSLADQLTTAAAKFESYASLDNDPPDRIEFFEGLALIKDLLRRLRGLDRLLLYVDSATDESRLDGDGCRWFLWTAGDPSERHVWDGCGVPCENGWLTDEDWNDATGQPLVRCLDCVIETDEPLDEEDGG